MNADEVHTLCSLMADDASRLMELALNETNLMRNKDLIPREAGLRDKYGKTALMYAAEFGSYRSVALLAPHEAGLQDNLGWTALMYSASRGDFQSVQLLIEKEAGKQNKAGDTALMLAVRLRHQYCAELLVEKEAGFVNDIGDTALYYALTSLGFNLVSLLAPHEAKISAEQIKIRAQTIKAHGDAILDIVERYQ